MLALIYPTEACYRSTQSASVVNMDEFNVPRAIDLETHRGRGGSLISFQVSWSSPSDIASETEDLTLEPSSNKRTELRDEL